MSVFLTENPRNPELNDSVNILKFRRRHRLTVADVVHDVITATKTPPKKMTFRETKLHCRLLIRVEFLCDAAETSKNQLQITSSGERTVSGQMNLEKDRDEKLNAKSVQRSSTCLIDDSVGSERRLAAQYFLGWFFEWSFAS